MPVYALIATLLLVLAYGTERELRSSELNSAEAELSMLASNMLVYRAALAEFAYNNPAAAGTPQDAQLSLPSWWIHQNGVSGYVQAGSSYAYYASPPAGLASKLSSITGSVAVGYVSAGQIVSPSVGATGIAVPAAVPNGAAVAYR